MPHGVERWFHVAFWMGTATHLALTVLNWEHETVGTVGILETITDITFTRRLGGAVCLLGVGLVAGGILLDAEYVSHRHF